jgi:hypothetical protein
LYERRWEPYTFRPITSEAHISEEMCDAARRGEERDRVVSELIDLEQSDGKLEDQK